jgi:hypothetical protein
MKQHTGLSLIVTLACLGVMACSDDGNNPSPSTDSSSSDSSGSSSAPTGTSTSTGGTGATGATTTAATSTGPTGNSTSTGASTGSTSATDATSSGPTCEIGTLSVFARSDTEADWDDNDFSDVTTEGTCPVLVNVTWPHEAGWEAADPSEANQEQTHFTLDSYYSTDLTGKQLNLTIELVEDVRGPEATTGGYEVALVSVSSYEYEEVQYPEETIAPADAGVALGDASVDGGELPVVDAAAPEPVIVTQTGYSEAQSTVEDRVVLRHVGDRATVKFVLPNKTEEISSYDPARVIKINARIYNLFTPAVEEPPVDTDVVAGDAGIESAAPATDTGSSSSAASSSAASSSATSSSADSSSSAQSSAESLSSSASTAAESTSSAAPPSSGIVYSYLTSKFAITGFTVTDAE